MAFLIETLFNAAFAIWNALIDVAVNLFTVSPLGASSSVYSTVKSLYDAITDISVPIAIVFFLIAIINDVITCPAEQQLHRFLSDALKFTVIIGVVANLWTIMGYIMQIADGITNQFSSAGDYSMSLSDDLVNAIEEATKYEFNLEDTSGLFAKVVELLKQLVEWVFTLLILLFAALATLGIIVASCVSILSSAFQRILKPLVLLPFSSITVAMGAGSGSASQVMTSYLKSFFGVCLSGAFMVICVKLGVALSKELIVFNLSTSSTLTKVIFVCVQTMITPIVISGMCKAADSMLGRFF